MDVYRDWAPHSADRFFNLGYKDFAVPDFAGLCFFQNRFDRTLSAIIADHDFEFDFWKKIHGVFGAAVDFAVSLLPAESLYLAQSHAFDACSH